MGKKKIRRKRRPSQPHPSTNSVTSDTRKPPVIPTHVITNINRFTSTAFLLIYVYLTINITYYFERARSVLFVSAFITFLLCLIKISVQQNIFALFTSIRIDPNIRKRFRKYVVWGFTLNIFLIITPLMPVLYAAGYITRFAGWLQSLLPGKIEIGDKSAITISFVLIAAVSGIIGNLSYDILKFIFKKLREKKMQH